MTLIYGIMWMYEQTFYLVLSMPMKGKVSMIDYIEKPNETNEPEGIDIHESGLLKCGHGLLEILLFDRTTRKKIIWATKDYSSLGDSYSEQSEIMPELFTGVNRRLIQPRTAKAQNMQAGRTRNKAEVFTPSWICNIQNNLVDAQWFGRSGVFNVESNNSWTTTFEPVDFNGAKGDWRQYIDAKRMEVSCGEAPYLVSRYDTVTGEKIPLSERIGILDRKLRIVGENASSDEEWLKWSRRAVESVYGFEFQGDNLLLARENILYSYVEYYFDYFRRYPDLVWLKKIALTISWNIFQMDGLKGVVPCSCRPIERSQVTLFDDEDESGVCPGCAKGDIFRHTGIYCKIKDWRGKKTQTYISLLKGGN